MPAAVADTRATERSGAKRGEGVGARSCGPLRTSRVTVASLACRLAAAIPGTRTPVADLGRQLAGDGQRESPGLVEPSAEATLRRRHVDGAHDESAEVTHRRGHADDSLFELLVD